MVKLYLKIILEGVKSWLKVFDCLCFASIHVNHHTKFDL